ncbi:MAG: hypothetical protein KAQ92_01235, partial [Candidatus Aenigmarchaeota archaeon]|nr:hypothetical protein [Candidatus Aenigmarchaeota archaeon]
MEINSENLNKLLNGLKSLYETEKVKEKRRQYIVELVNNYGYIPYPHIKVLNEFSEAETIIALEEKLKLNNNYKEEKFIFDKNTVSPVKKADFQDSDWLLKEQHNIKLINLAGLGNGNFTRTPGKFIDWLKQLIILPSGNPEKGVLSTTVYLIPFHPREFGCAYIPKDSGVSQGLEDSFLKENLDLNAKNQVKLFTALAQLAGHPVIYDVLPQTGRFSKIILANPYAARWFDIKKLIREIIIEIIGIKSNLNNEYGIENFENIEFIANILINELSGKYEEIPENLEWLYVVFAEKIEPEKKRLSNLMLSEETQKIISKKAKKIINETIKKSEDENISEENITEHERVIAVLINEGLWPSPGGAWNSAGIPIFKKIHPKGGYPLFKHYDYEGND